MRSGIEWGRTVALAAFVVAGAGHAQDDPDASLEAVRRELGALEQHLAQQNESRDRAAEDLRRVELDIAAARRELEQIETASRVEEQAAAALYLERSAARQRLAAEQAALAELVRLVYVNGQEGALKLLLSQRSPATVGRALVYYDYFRQAYGERLTAVSAELAALAKLAVDAEQIETQLADLRLAGAAKVAALDRARAERASLLADLETSIAAAGSAIDRLQDEEARLERLIEELGAALAAFPIDAEAPFQSLKGRLPWPVDGVPSEEFGRPRDGTGIAWNGVLLRTTRGEPVRAVYHGRVAFADWLAGLGLLTIIDHGEGYMTLYGHSEVLLKQVGDWVDPGEAIARAGDSGGQAEPGVYFEIRHDGKPVDPSAWIAP